MFRAARALLSIGRVLVRWPLVLFGGGPAIRPWRQVNPVGPDENGFGVDADLNDVALPDANTIVAVGNRGVIIRSTDFGATWTRPASGTSRDLFGVEFSDPTTGLAVGDWGVILATTDGGATWRDITPGSIWSARDEVSAAPREDGTNYQIFLPGPDYCLRKVAFSWNQLDRAVAVGDVNGGRALLLVTESAGLRWSDQSDWSVTGLRDVRFSDVAALAVGGYPYNPWAPYNAIFSSDDGASCSSPATRPPAFCTAPRSLTEAPRSPLASTSSTSRRRTAGTPG